MKIAILGCGGVGGYYGGRLAVHYYNDSSKQVIFLARGKQLEAIRANGLKVLTPQHEFIARPFEAAESVAGTLDLILVCVKACDLGAAMEQVRENITADTIIVPLVNGIEAYELLRRRFPQARVFQGCCYLNSFIEKPGVVKFIGGFEQVQIGFEDEELLQQTAGILSAAGLDVFSGRNISGKVWEKFLFGSVFSAIGSLHNESFGEIASSPGRMMLARKMLEEVKAVANAKGISFRLTIVGDLLAKFTTFSKEARTSMQLDFASGKRTELETFVGYVIRCADEFQIEIPAYREIYALLSARDQSR